MDTAKNKLSNSIKTLNRCYAKRVLDWCEGKQDPLIKEDIDGIIHSVCRTIGKEMIIKVNRPVNIIKNKNQVANILQEDVRFEHFNYRFSDNLQLKQG